MSWLVGLLAALAAASSSGPHKSGVSYTHRSTDRAPRTLTYRSRDGSAYFHFRFSPAGGDIRIHILEFPGTGSCHVLHDHRGAYICWSRPIRSIAEAKAVTAIWAEATLVYQRTGRAF